MKLYALYKGEKFVDVGTAKELAARHKVKRDTIYWLASPAAHKRDRGKMVFAVPIED